ncbi:MAG: phosphoribosylformylglycinamidine synthase subunit PurQ [Spirochaetaceae bacterium]|jgi:phosphoribosylformylglycinamidine synthase|nr:phosphoribosylformylglycinamidine synthase subunit PurQ [Spirochaetaceae bacterium]
MSPRRIYVEKKPGFDIEARTVWADITNFLGPQYPALARLANVRIVNRYEITGNLTEEQFGRAAALVFSEPPCDRVFVDDESVRRGDFWFGVEYLPGQYDQRADSSEQCLELALGRRPRVRCAKLYILVPDGGTVLDAAELAAVKAYLINPVDSRELRDFSGDETSGNPPGNGLSAGDVPVLEGFTGMDAAALARLAAEYGLAMSGADLAFCRRYFAAERRDPTLTELRVLDTYWSDHCRHTTFTTILESIGIADNDAVLRQALDGYEAARREVYGPAAETYPRTLMDMATIGARVLKKRGLFDDVDESKEINACTIKVRAEFARSAGEAAAGNITEEPWLLLFKNETHNHPTEIEPLGGAATCLGGAIRDPLSGRAYVHQAMRITGGGDPRTALSETLPGKLPQVKIAREAAAGYSSYGNQIGLATGQVAEFYHPGYLAKRLELGAVIGAVPAAQVRRAEPERGDLVLLIGGKTGRDGIGGATGSSKVHTGESVETAGAEVQKGNAVEERKLQRLFRDPEVSRLIKRCNDFGAGGVSVAVGELAPGLDINLDAAPKKYAGLDGTELALSESQERMAVVAAPADAETLIQKAAAENLDAVVIAKITFGEAEGNPISFGAVNDNPLTGAAEDNPVTGEARLRMSWQGKTIVDLSRRFLDSNGAPRSAKAVLRPGTGMNRGAGIFPEAEAPRTVLDKLERELASLRSGSRRGLQERFDGSIGASSVLFPWGGREQGTPECGMAALLPLPPETEKDGRPGDGPAVSMTASLMTFGFDPALTQANPYEGAKGAVKEVLAKFACLGGNPWKARLSLQEYFERMETDESWGKPAAALLGALEAQLALGVPAIGGKDSMSGSYRDPAAGVDIAVPPTVVVFAAGTVRAPSVRSGALSGKPGNPVILLYPGKGAMETPAGEWTLFRANMNGLAALTERGLVLAAYPVGAGGIAAALALMAFGSMTGVEVRSGCLGMADERNYSGAVLAELDGEALRNSGHGREIDTGGLLQNAAWTEAAYTIAEPVFRVVREGRASATGGEPSAEVPLAQLRQAYECPLAQVYPQTSGGGTAAKPAAGSLAEGGNRAACMAAGPDAGQNRENAGRDTGSVRRNQPGAAGSRSVSGGPAVGPAKARPLVALPVFPGTNCEWDMQRAFREAGARTRLVIFRNRNPGDIRESTKELAAAIGDAQILALPGGFSAGDEPDGSGKFIANAFRSPVIADAVQDLLDRRDGLALGICNGFQALIKLGLVPYGRYTEASASSPTLTFNRIGRHVSRMVRTRVLSVSSPWLALEEPGAIHVLPVSHGEGRLVIGEDEARALFAAGQAPFCYAGADGQPALSEPDNPNGSDHAIEALTSPDGRILGKMGHSERRGPFVHINIPGNKTQRIFEAGVRYFR